MLNQKSGQSLTNANTQKEWEDCGHLKELIEWGFSQLVFMIYESLIRRSNSPTGRMRVDIDLKETKEEIKSGKST